MFTGIVAGLAKIATIQAHAGLLQFEVELQEKERCNIAVGASVAIDGVCLTVTRIGPCSLYFDVMAETQNCTTLGSLQPQEQVNIERSLRFGEELGGHLLSGHVTGTAEIESIHFDKQNCILRFCCNKEWMNRILPKGYIAVDGVSLTVVDACQTGRFSVHLIPETRRRTTLGLKQPGQRVNIELDSQTCAIVHTIERLHNQMTMQITLQTEGERFYDITSSVQEALDAHLQETSKSPSGALLLFVLHTSCALTISEGYDPTAKQDLERFLQHLAPRDLAFIRHTLEGDDDSASHMKSILLHQSLTLVVEEGKVALGRWQSLYLAEFRDRPHTRRIVGKYLPG